tara:strand:+ start:2400 stop:3581 length:1182 start_codon:yes stop_codon:yes gene_type:complete
VTKTQTGNRVVIVGGGIFGCTAALELLSRGWSVSIVNPGGPPHEDAASTDVSKVVRMDYGSDVFYHELGEMAIEGWKRWNRDWPRPLYHEDGFLILSHGQMQPGEYEYENHHVLGQRGYDIPRLNMNLASTDYPAWDFSGYSDGYFNPTGGWVESGAVVEKIAKLCKNSGVQFYSGHMDQLYSEGSRVSGVLTTDGNVIPGNIVVVAAGAWTPTLLPWLTDLLSPTGQPVLHFLPENPDLFRADRFPPWNSDIASSGWYGFPALSNGRVKVAHHGRGVSVHPDSRGKVDVNHEIRAREFLEKAIPALSQAPIVYRRICMYCDAFDGNLLIGHDPSREGLVVASGGSGHGFKFAPLLGEVIADAVEHHPNKWGARFSWREAGALTTEEARYTGQ